jgi:polyribonucleotide nucleotidyltransferase
MRALNGGKRIENVDDVVSIGQKIQVEITKIDDRGKLSLEIVDDSEPVAPVAAKSDDADSSVSSVSSVSAE